MYTMADKSKTMPDNRANIKSEALEFEKLLKL